MILNLLTQHTNIIKVSYYDALSPNVLSTGYTIKTDSDILSWKLTNPSVSSVTFTIICHETKKLKDIEYEILGGSNNANITTTIKTSIDYSNWYELNYYYDKVNYLYNPYIFIKLSENEFLNTTTNEVVPNDVNFRYIFKKENNYTNEIQYLYPSLEFKYITVTLNNLSASESNPIYFSRFNILIEEDFQTSSLDTNLLETKSENLTPQKMFEEYDFIPDTVKNFMKMLEDNKLDLLTNLLKSKIFIGEFNANLGSQGFQGIENDFIEYDLVVY